MDLEKLKPFPPRFFMRDLAAITAPVFELKKNPHQAAAYKSTKEWFMKFVESSYFSQATLIVWFPVLVFTTEKRRRSSYHTALTFMPG